MTKKAGISTDFSPKNIGYYEIRHINYLYSILWNFESSDSVIFLEIFKKKIRGQITHTKNDTLFVENANNHNDCYLF